MDAEKKKLINSLVFPAIFVALMWITKLVELVFQIKLTFLGIFPLHWVGLPGILTAPFIHGDFSHLLANSGPMLILGSVIFYFYRGIAWWVFLLIYLITNFWVWIMAREAWHIGASGLIYGMAAYVFTAGVLRRDSRLLATSLLVVFLYGSLIWGIFPELFPEKNISWESHLMGLIAGVVVAFYYRKEGPPKKIYTWEDEEEETPEWFPEEPPAETEDETKKLDNNTLQPPRVHYEYKPTEDPLKPRSS